MCRRDETAHQNTVFLFGGLNQFYKKERADDLCGISQIHRLCVFASGSLITVIVICR